MVVRSLCKILKRWSLAMRFSAGNSCPKQSVTLSNSLIIFHTKIQLTIVELLIRYLTILLSRLLFITEGKYGNQLKKIQKYRDVLSSGGAMKLGVEQIK